MPGLQDTGTTPETLLTLRTCGAMLLNMAKYINHAFTYSATRAGKATLLGCIFLLLSLRLEILPGLQQLITWT